MPKSASQDSENINLQSAAVSVGVKVGEEDIEYGSEVRRE